jgi:diguanylate cyclase (GGDEF)-like protein
VLKEISQTIQQVCRTSDMVFRYGGEEFVVLLSKTEQEGAITIAERLRNTIRREPFVVNGDEMALTVSIGVSTRRNYPKDKADTLFERADRALYRAKANGRDCVVSSDESSERTPS